MDEGKEGDWECSGCNNRNYAFRSFCNRCKQPRLLVDSKTPADSKWLPRIGDWICTGCTNNNYASRETCKKCGEAKEVAAMPAIAMPGASLPTYSHYFSRAPGGLGNIGSISNGASYQPLPLASVWPAGGVHNYAIQSSSVWPFVGNQLSGSPLASPSNHPVSTPKGWRNGDWLCDCGFHNYSSRAQCKNCSASVVPALGTKRLASEGFSNDWENKRLNSGNTYVGFDKMIGATDDASPNWRAPAQFPHQAFQKKIPHQVPMPALLGKGAKQWRNGDWMCTNCNNHNYASRSECNRCKTNRDAAAQPFLQPVNVV